MGHTQDTVQLAKLIGVICAHCIQGKCYNNKREWKIWSSKEEGSTYTDECRSEICDYYELGRIE